MIPITKKKKEVDETEAGLTSPSQEMKNVESSIKNVESSIKNVESSIKNVESSIKNVESSIELGMTSSTSDAMNKRGWKKLFSKMFGRSKSEGSIKVPNLKDGKESSVAARPRRKFVRIEKDANALPPEVLNDNPYVQYKYSQEFLQEHYSAGDLSNKPLPYSTSGHTILKKSSGDLISSENNSPSSSKHATFNDIVEVHEYSGLDVVNTDLHIMHEAKLCDEEEETGYFLEDSDDNEGTEGTRGFFLENYSCTDVDVSDEKEEDQSTDLKKLRLDLAGVENAGDIADKQLDRMDGIRQNIFSAMGNPNSLDGIAEAQSEPAKRVNLVERIKFQDESENSETNSTKVKSEKSSGKATDTSKRAKLAQLNQKDLKKDVKPTKSRRSRPEQEEMTFDFAC